MNPRISGVVPPSNIFERAANAWDRDEALYTLRTALNITPDPFTEDLLPKREFNSSTYVQRLQLIASYLQAEVYAAIDRANPPATSPATYIDPMLADLLDGRMTKD